MYGYIQNQTTKIIIDHCTCVSKLDEPCVLSHQESTRLSAREHGRQHRRVARHARHRDGRDGRSHPTHHHGNREGRRRGQRGRRGGGEDGKRGGEGGPRGGEELRTDGAHPEADRVSRQPRHREDVLPPPLSHQRVRVITPQSSPCNATRR